MDGSTDLQRIADAINNMAQAYSKMAELMASDLAWRQEMTMEHRAALSEAMKKADETFEQTMKDILNDDEGEEWKHQ